MAVRWLLVVLMAAAGALAADGIHCASVRADGGLLSTLVEQVELDILDGTRRPAVVGRLPWKVVPSDLAFSGRNGTLADLSSVAAGSAEGALWLHALLSRHLTLVSFEPLGLGWGPVRSEGAEGCYRGGGGGDRLEMRWAATSYWKVFADLPVPCRYSGEQLYAVSYAAEREWGSEPRLETSGAAFYPSIRSGRGESMERVLRTTNADKPELVELNLRYRSGDVYPLSSLSYRACVSMDLERLRADAGSYAAKAPLSRTPPSDAELAELGFAREPPHGPEEEATDDSSSSSSSFVARPSRLLWPTHSCVQTDRAGACTTDLGYLSTYPYDVEVPASEPHNFLVPRDLVHVSVPAVFSPGSHPRALRVRWFCAGKHIGQWVDLKWTLLGTTTTVTRRSPRCDSDRDFRPPLPDRIAEHRRPPPSVAPMDGYTADALLPALFGRGRRLLGAPTPTFCRSALGDLILPAATWAGDTVELSMPRLSFELLYADPGAPEPRVEVAVACVSLDGDAGPDVARTTLSLRGRLSPLPRMLHFGLSPSAHRGWGAEGDYREGAVYYGLPGSAPPRSPPGCVALRAEARCVGCALRHWSAELRACWAVEGAVAEQEEQVACESYYCWNDRGYFAPCLPSGERVFDPPANGTCYEHKELSLHPHRYTNIEETLQWVSAVALGIAMYFGWRLPPPLLFI